MKSAIIAVCIVACAYASSIDEAATVLRNDYQQNPEGSYQYVYETDNGIAGQATGTVKEYGKGEVAIEVTGSNSFKSPEGQVYQLNYIANENGYQPQADYLPTPPAPQPIPDYIVRALEYIRTHPYDETKQ